MTNFLPLRPIGRCAALILAALIAVAPGRAAGPAAAGADQSVRLVVDYGDGVVKTISNLAWAKGETVFDAMKAAAARPHGVSFSYTGAGDAVVLTKIDDVQNEGRGAGRKNWQYWVNGVYGERSFATFELQAHDEIVWRFAVEQEK